MEYSAGLAPGSLEQVNPNFDGHPHKNVENKGPVFIDTNTAALSFANPKLGSTEQRAE